MRPERKVSRSGEFQDHVGSNLINDDGDGVRPIQFSHDVDTERLERFPEDLRGKETAIRKIAIE